MKNKAFFLTILIRRFRYLPIALVISLGVLMILGSAGQPTTPLNTNTSPISDAPKIEPQRVKLVINSKNQNLNDKIKEYFSSKASLDIINNLNNNTYQVTIKEIGIKEKERPERKETIRYGRFDVNLGGSLLYMPKNSTYAYDLTTGGVELHYEYEINIQKNRALVLSEKLSGNAVAEYGFCNDARIINVFGGIQPAGFVANTDMQSRCSKGQSANFNDAYSKIARTITDKVTDAIINDVRRPK